MTDQPKHDNGGRAIASHTDALRRRKEMIDARLAQLLAEYTAQHKAKDEYIAALENEVILLRGKR